MAAEEAGGKAVNRIERLLNELAPNGVPYRAIQDVSSKGSTIKWAETAAVLRYVDLASVDRQTHRVGETEVINAENAPSRAKQIVHKDDVIFATTRPLQMRWAVVPAELDGHIASTGYCVIRPDTSIIETGFLAHLLGTPAFAGYIERFQVEGNYPSISDQRVREFEIPVPPLEVQREIVGILDKFTALEAELEAELEARALQYAHYRDRLFEELSADSAPRRSLATVGTLTRGRRFTKADFVGAGIPCIHYGEIYTHYGTSARATISFVRDDMSAELRFAQPGDVVIAAVSETVEDVAKATAWLGDEPIAFHDDSFAFSSELNPVYAAHAMQTTRFQDQKERHVSRGKMKRIGAKGLGQLEIPVPSLEEQQRIVTALESFDSLVNNISAGLPAEIAARRRQYEYYRDRLLTFQEKAS